MNKYINVNFFRVTLSGEGDKTFQDVLKRLNGSNRKDRIININRVPVWLYEFNEDHSFIDGNMICSRMDDLPMKANLLGEIEELDFKDDEGIGEQTAFLYHKATRILLLQNVTGGVTVGRFANYFQKILKLDGAIIIEPLIEIDSLEKLRNTKTVKKLHFEIAKLDDIQLFEEEKRILEESVSLVNSTKAPVIEIILKTGLYRSQEVGRDVTIKLTNILSRISGREPEKIKKIQISGTSKEDESFFLDLLEQRIRERVEVESQLRVRSIPYEVRKKSMFKAWTNRKEELVKTYKI